MLTFVIDIKTRGQNLIRQISRRADSYVILCDTYQGERTVYAILCDRYQGERTSSSYGISDNYKAINWTPMNVHLLKTFYDTAPLSMQCNQSDGTRFPVTAALSLLDGIYSRKRSANPNSIMNLENSFDNS